MIRVVILGTGNLAKHLFDAFLPKEEIKVVQVVGRNKKALEYFGKDTQTVHDFNNIRGADIYIIAVSDDAITSVSQQLMKIDKFIVHTSGSAPMDALPKTCRKGVFYPLQTFTELSKVDFRTVPLCLEAETKQDLELLKQMASTLSNHVYEITSQQRKMLHLAAVLVNNFTNHLYHMASELCETHQLSFDLLKPLIKQTAAKVEKLSPFEAQTGPAKRGDVSTIENHLALLKDGEYRNIYSMLTTSIEKTHGKKL